MSNSMPQSTRLLNKNAFGNKTKSSKIQFLAAQNCDNDYEQNMCAAYDELIFNESMALIRNNKRIVEICKLLYNTHYMHPFFLIQILRALDDLEQEEIVAKYEFYKKNNLQDRINEWRNDHREYCLVTEYDKVRYNMEIPPYKPLVSKMINGVLYHAHCVCDTKHHKSAAAPFAAKENKNANYISYNTIFAKFIETGNSSTKSNSLYYHNLLQAIYNKKIKFAGLNDLYLNDNVFINIIAVRNYRDDKIKDFASLCHNYKIFDYLMENCKLSEQFCEIVKKIVNVQIMSNPASCEESHELLESQNEYHDEHRKTKMIL